MREIACQGSLSVGYILLWRSMIIGVSLLPSLSVYIRQANYEKLRKVSEKNAKTIGQTLNKLIEEKLETDNLFNYKPVSHVSR